MTCPNCDKTCIGNSKRLRKSLPLTPLSLSPQPKFLGLNFCTVRSQPSMSLSPPSVLSRPPSWSSLSSSAVPSSTTSQQPVEQDANLAR
eukprot:7106656-Prymnesium_polylepis.1